MLQECLTCATEEQNCMLLKADQTDVWEVLQQHFWFKIDDCCNQFLCDVCWSKISNFHQFFCEVQSRWNQKLDLKIEQSLEARQTCEASATDIVFACELIKPEPVDETGSCNGTAVGQNRCDADSEQEASPEKKDSSAEESSIPIKERLLCTRRKKRKRLTNKQDTLSQSKIKYSCDTCNPSRTFKYDDDLQVHTAIYHAKEEDKVHKCNQCEKSFTTEWQLSGHQSWHESVKSLGISCEQCNKYFITMRIKNAHMRAHHTTPQSAKAKSPDESTESQLDKLDETAGASRKKPAEKVLEEDSLIRRFCKLLCAICGSRSDSFSMLWKHFKTQHKQHGYAICCGRKFKRKQMLYDHCLLHIDPKSFRCEECDKTFKNHEALEKHNQWVHTPDSEKPFKCSICDVAYFKIFHLRNHMKYHIALEQKTFLCQECDKSFGTSLLLRSHQQKIHGAPSSLVCEICAKGFVYQSLLEKHRLTHSAEGVASLKVQCEHCGKWSKSKELLQNHLKRCQASGPVICDICEKKIANKPALLRHKRDMHRDRPALLCKFCGKAYRQVIRLKEHEAAHRGENLYSCPYCSMKCNSSAVMHAHKKTVHAEL
ncbi:zinc finger protein 93-like isoform X2 [Wyeomyia smithii]|uniref:zinc finger protein 93-like isoform X2 n=1 Tax=Wyeomyia smithii TaxID=174621 RepID=UPI002467CD68|nr:zinc finger protein 93-like isoform X2 [Wyeomyia smithii]